MARWLQEYLDCQQRSIMFQINMEACLYISFFSQPFAVATAFTGLEGKYVTIEDTVRSFKELVEGKYDHIPEGFFMYAGSIDEVVERAKQPVLHNPEENQWKFSEIREKTKIGPKKAFVHCQFCFYSSYGSPGKLKNKVG